MDSGFKRYTSKLKPFLTANLFSSRKRFWIKASFSVAIFVWFCFCLPDPLFSDPTSTVLEDKNGELLAAKIADDGQWRFPMVKNVPKKFAEALINFEDKRFYQHPGFDPLALIRAIQINLSNQKVRSGGSTISMQVIRLSRKGKRRTYFEKLLEIILALRLEIKYSKDEILSLYVSHAPFGGNVVGLEAASWRYFGRSPKKLSWAESAMLAVLPNNPSLVFPGKNEKILLSKRNLLLESLKSRGKIDALTCSVSKQEKLPGKPYPLPRLAPHLLTRAINEGYKGQRIRSTLIKHLQSRVNEIIEKHYKTLKGKEIYNSAALILEPLSGNVLAYIGNTSDNSSYANDVDIIASPRSTGSILKPFLFAGMINEGDILPSMLIPDIPTQISGYQPKNFNHTYDGVVPAKNALARSLNIPAVKLLQSYGVPKFHFLLKKLGISTLKFHPDHYGLSLILGGAEATLWDLTNAYAGMARTLIHYNNHSNYKLDQYQKAHYNLNSEQPLNSFENSSLIDAGSLWLTFEAILEVMRPDDDFSWRHFSSGKKIAWKTGTSYGFRDGWAIGTTPEYVVGVWVGNASGEGRPELTGIGTAAPILFDIYSILPPTTWFDKPEQDLTKIEVCKKSGYRSLDHCTEKMTTLISQAGTKTSPCPYHQLIHLDATGTFRVNSECEDVQNMKQVSWFVLPPAMEWYYKRKDYSYKVLPPYKEECRGVKQNKNMDFIYPRDFHQVYIPIGFNGTPGKLIMEVAHRNPNTKIHWHMDNEYLTSTSTIHQVSTCPSPGKHVITVVDEYGESCSQQFEVLENGNKTLR